MVLEPEFMTGSVAFDPGSITAPLRRSSKACHRHRANRGSLLGDLRRGRRIVSGGTSVVFPILGL